jgi:hypothetical protein
MSLISSASLTFIFLSFSITDAASNGFVVEEESNHDNFIEEIMGIKKRYVAIESSFSTRPSVLISSCFNSEYNEFIETTIDDSDRRIDTSGPVQSTSDQLGRCVESIKPFVARQDTTHLNSFVHTMSWSFLLQPNNLEEFTSRSSTMCSRSFSQLLLYYEANKDQIALTSPSHMSPLLPYYCLLSSYALLSLPDTESSYSSYYSIYLSTDQSPLRLDSNSMYHEETAITASTMYEKVARGVPLLCSFLLGETLDQNQQKQLDGDIHEAVNTIATINKMAINSVVLVIMRWSSTTTMSAMAGFVMILAFATWVTIISVFGNTATTKSEREKKRKVDGDVHPRYLYDPYCPFAHEEDSTRMIQATSPNDCPEHLGHEESHLDILESAVDDRYL